MKNAALAIFLLIPSLANAADSVWVQAVSGGYEARIVTAAGACPMLKTDRGDTQMAVRAPADSNFALTCSAPLPAAITWARVGDTTLPLPISHPRRIVVLGDTGCRIKGSALQNCNDPARWPFPTLAAAAARLKPDLVIHVGDYLYRESACPKGNEGCAGSPWGDNWTTWKADFFDPAAPLFQAAPIVFVRGNHETCTRAGPGWTRLQGPSAYDPAMPCLRHQPLFLIDLGGLDLAVLDDAVSEETDLDHDSAQVYAAEIESLAPLPVPVWLIHHRPTWGAADGPLGIPIGGNLSLIEASQIAEAKGMPPIPHSVVLMISGHIHTFESINYSQDVPPQIIAGNGGTKLLKTPRDLKGAQFVGHAGVSVADGLSVGGFGFLVMTQALDGWTIDLYDPSAHLKGQCHFTAPKNGSRGRLDCPDLKG